MPKELTLNDFNEMQYAPPSGRAGCPESPSVLSVQAHAIPTVSALAFVNNDSPQKEKKHKISSKVNQRSGQTTDRLMNDFFTTANVDQNCDELEKKQLKEALSALSERLLLL